MARGLDPVLVGAYDAQAVAVQAWLAGLGEADLTAPSRLPGWRVAELAVHLANSGRAYTDAAAAPPVAGARPLTVSTYLGAYAAAAAEIAAREVGAARGVSATELRAGFAESVAGVRAAIAAQHGADPVLAARRGPIRSSDLLRTRVLELVVHTLDVRPGPALDRQAVRVGVRLLAEVLVERNPGRTVEVRVPPYVAVQIGAPDSPGPAHTRGTPPNVVECAPEVFLAVASGRRTWAEAFEAGEVRASGERADLSPYLPLF